MVKVLITGGAGFIGFHLAKYLANKNYETVILDNFTRGIEDEELKQLLEKENVSLIKADVTNSNFTSKLDKDYDQIYHLAAINGTENFYKMPHKVLKVGILGTINLLDWFTEEKIKGKFLFSSSSEAYAGALNLLKEKFPIPTPENIPLVVEDPKNVRWSYGGSKIMSEIAIYSYAKAFNLKNFSIIRYHNIYGPRMGYEHVIPQFIERIVKKENPFKIYGGTETRTFCYIDDGIKATNLVMENKNANEQTIHIGRDDQEIKIIELAKSLFEIANFYPKIDIQPSPQGCVARRCPDITKLKELGYTPEINLKEGLRKTYDWYKDKY